MTRETFIETYAKGYNGDAQSMEKKLADLAGFCYDATKHKGTATAAAVAALTDMENGDQYRVILESGDLNEGDDAITALVGDVVRYNGETGLWEFVVSGAAINV